MPTVAISQLVGSSVIDSQEQSRVLFRRSALIELVIEQTEQRSGRNLDALRPCRHDPARARHRPHSHRFAHLRQALHAVGAHSRVDSRHQQRRRNSLPADIANGQNQLVGTGCEEVVVVAAHSARWAAEAVHFERFQFRNLPRKQLRLHFLRDSEFAFQPLLFFLLQNQLLDGLGHRVERQRELRQLVRGFDWNAMTEVAAIHMLGGVI